MATKPKPASGTTPASRAAAAKKTPAASAPRYSPVTAPASQINAPGFVSAYKLDNSPAPTPTTANPEGRYTPGTSEYEQYVTGLPREVTEDDAAKIRKTNLDAMNGVLAAINQQYDVLVAQEKERGLTQMGQTRSINARSGILTSDFGAAHMDNTQKGIDQQVKTIENERMGKIATALYGAEQMSKQEIEARRAEARGNTETYVQFLKEKQGKVLDIIGSYAAGGGSLDKLKTSEPDIYKMFADQYGGSDLLLTAAYNSMAPAAQKREYRYEVKGNKVVAYSVNPATGALEVKSESIPGLDGAVAGEYDIKTAANGQLYFIPKEIDPSKPLDQQVIKYGSAGQFKDQGGDPKETESEKNRRARSSMAGELTKVTGGDGFVSPNDYQKALNLWVGRGFGSKEFHEAFSNFRNPNNDYGNIY